MITKTGVERASWLTKHKIIEADARDLSFIATESVHFVCTSPPYASLIQYPDHSGQLGNIASYEIFLEEMDKVWAECLRILVPGGRVACIVGDVCISRRQGGRHYVLPLSGDFQSRTRKLGFDNLTPIRWQKIANMKLEASRSGRFLGKPNLPNGIVKNDIENILFFRKPGGYRSPTPEMERLSKITTDDYVKWFSPIWTDVKGQMRKEHPAPYPIEVPRRLIRMFSFAGDTVVDTFGGTGSTAMAALETGRNSISVDIEPKYVSMMEERLTTLGGIDANVEVHRKAPAEVVNVASVAS
ncbi:DNA-methyltransferase [Devosia sp. CN2-171]|uniref:DNA-methyltransferase n=1 Tax=Devosia sp. CN2-171 TaxID=3400909 RepID=UPI003BF7EA54